MKTFFWNTSEKRLRMVWRLLGQLLIFLPILIGLQIIVVGIAFVISSSQGGVTPLQLSDPAAAQSFITNTPWLLLINSLSTGLAMVVSIFIAGRLLDRRPFTDFGFHLSPSWWRDFGFGLALGGFLMALIFIAELSAGWITITGTMVTSKPNTRFLPQLLSPLVIFIAVGFYEELFSRGYQLTNFAEGFTGKAFNQRAGIIIATILSSAIFGILHASNPNASTFSTVNITIAGFFLAVGYLLTGELAIPIGLHITWNFFQGNVFGFPVSGGDFRSATFIAIDQGGPTVFTGGAFGPEAGLIGLIAMLVGIILTILWVKHFHGSAALKLSIAIPPTTNSNEINPVVSTHEVSDS